MSIFYRTRDPDAACSIGYMPWISPSGLAMVFRRFQPITPVNRDLHKLMEETLKSYFERIGEKEISQ